MGLSHHGDKPEQIEKFAKLNIFQVAAVRAISSRSCGDARTATATCSTTAILLYGGAMSNPNVHLHVNLPLVVAGGGAGRLKGGRHLAFAPATTCR